MDHDDAKTSALQQIIDLIEAADLQGEALITAILIVAKKVMDKHT